MSVELIEFHLLKREKLSEPVEVTWFALGSVLKKIVYDLKRGFFNGECRLFKTVSKKPD